MYQYLNKIEVDASYIPSTSQLTDYNSSPIEWFKLFHEQNMRLHGIHIPNVDPFICQNSKQMFREFRLQMSHENSSLDQVSLKLPMVTKDRTPYSFSNGNLFFNNNQLIFDHINIQEVKILPAENSWHLKGYTFPYRGSKNPYYELRINLRITGFCPGKCFFCHRTHSHRIKPEKRNVVAPNLVINRIINAEGNEILKKIKRVMFIAELFGKEEKFLSAVKSTKAELLQHGYSIQNEYNCCAHDVRSKKGLKILRKLVIPDRYSFTLEFFTRRKELMGQYKGLPMKDVYQILSNAREVGFQEIQLNYMAGIDSLKECIKGFTQLKKNNLVDSVGLSTFTCFSQDQLAKRHPEAWAPIYYLEIINVLNSLGIKIYKPESYDMGCAYSVLMDKTLL